MDVLPFGRFTVSDLASGEEKRREVAIPSVLRCPDDALLASFECRLAIALIKGTYESLTLTSADSLKRTRVEGEYGALVRACCRPQLQKLR